LDLRVFVCFFKTHLFVFPELFRKKQFLAWIFVCISNLPFIELDLKKYTFIQVMSIVAFDHRLDCINNEQNKIAVLQLISNIERHGELTANLLYSLPIWAVISTSEWKKFVETSDYLFEFVSLIYSQK
jgi:hypothetical protein